MSVHAATVYFAICHTCGKKSRFKDTAKRAIWWEVMHAKRVHHQTIKPAQLAALGHNPFPERKEKLCLTDTGERYGASPSSPSPPESSSASPSVSVSEPATRPQAAGNAP